MPALQEFCSRIHKRAAMLLSRKFILLLLLLVSQSPLFGQGNIQTLTLQRALQVARQNNPVLKSQALNIGIAQSDVVTAGLRPNLVLNNQSLQLVKPSGFEPGTGWVNGKNMQTWWQLTKTFQIAGLRGNKIATAQKNVSLSEKTFQEAERNLFLEVGLKWLEVWGLQKQLEILRQAKSNTDSLVTINRLRLKNEVITETDLVRAELLNDQYTVEIKSVSQDYQNELINIRTLLGEKTEVAIDTSDRFALFEDRFNIDSLLAASVETRPDVLALKSLVEVSEANIKLQKSLAYPQPELGVIYNPQNTIPYLGVYATIELPFFSRNQGEIQKSGIVKKQAEQDLAASRVLVNTEITTAQRSYLTIKANVEGFDRLLLKADRILSSVRYSYLRGGTTIIDLLEAQRGWLDTREQYYKTLQQYRQSYIRLLHASGLINQLAN